MPRKIVLDEIAQQNEKEKKDCIEPAEDIDKGKTGEAESEKKKQPKKKQAGKSSRPLEMPSVPKGTVYINHRSVEKLVKRRVAKTVAERMNAGYEVIRKSELDELRAFYENASKGGTQYLGQERKYRIIDQKYGTASEIREGVTRIGIDDSFADYVVRGSLAVSRKHAVMTLAGGNLTVRDIGSTNHTYIDGSRIADNVETELRDGSTLRLGDREFIIQAV